MRRGPDRTRRGRRGDQAPSDSARPPPPARVQALLGVQGPAQAEQPRPRRDHATRAPRVAEEVCDRPSRSLRRLERDRRRRQREWCRQRRRCGWRRGRRLIDRRRIDRRGLRLRRYGRDRDEGGRRPRRRRARHRCGRRGRPLESDPVAPAYRRAAGRHSCRSDDACGRDDMAYGNAARVRCEDPARAARSQGQGRSQGDAHRLDRRQGHEREGDDEDDGHADDEHDVDERRNADKSPWPDADSERPDDPVAVAGDEHRCVDPADDDHDRPAAADRAGTGHAVGPVDDAADDHDRPRRPPPRPRRRRAILVRVAHRPPAPAPRTAPAQDSPSAP